MIMIQIKISNNRIPQGPLISDLTINKIYSHSRASKHKFINMVINYNSDKTSNENVVLTAVGIEKAIALLP